MTWWQQEAWYWPNCHKIFWFHHQKGWHMMCWIILKKGRYIFTGLILGFFPTNERHYKIMPSLINAVSHWLAANLESALYLSYFLPFLDIDLVQVIEILSSSQARHRSAYPILWILLPLMSWQGKEPGLPAGMVLTSFVQDIILPIWYSLICFSESWWLHQMEIFSALLVLSEGSPPVTGGFPSQRPVMRSFDEFSLISTWTNGWANNRDDGDLRCHHAHYFLSSWPQMTWTRSIPCLLMLWLLVSPMPSKI